MARILTKRILNPTVTLMDLDAPLIARKAQPGQFVIVRPNEHGERIPLTIADYDRDRETITIIFQIVGKTTAVLGEMNEGDDVLDLVGPLGKASELEGHERVAVVGGGVGCAIAYPQAKALHAMGAAVDVFAGFRGKDLIILEQEMAAASDRLFMMTDDGSNGNQGFVTAALEKELEAGAKYDLVIAIGPLVMMRAVANLTRPYGIHTVVSMNSTMIDGTGMCGGCRVMVDGEMKFACVDGPDFDAHLIDFDEAMRRGGVYREQERRSLEDYQCQLLANK